jgi:hypothetical protein
MNDVGTGAILVGMLMTVKSKESPWSAVARHRFRTELPSLQRHLPKRGRATALQGGALY